MYLSKKRKSETNGLLDISLDDNCSIDNENVVAKKPKKKKKKDKSLNPNELDTNYDPEIKTFETIHKKVKNQNLDSVSNVSFKKKRKSKINASADTSMKINSIIDKDQIVTEKTPKKKKKHDKSLNPIKLNTNYDAEIETFETTREDVTETYINEVSQEIKSEINTSSDISMANYFTLDNEHVSQTIKPNKNKEHDNSLNSIELDKNYDENMKKFETTQITDQNINDSVNNVNFSKKKKSQINPATDVSFENNYIIDDQNVTENTPKRKKKQDKRLNSTDITTDPHILEKNNELKALLKSMESYDFLNSSTPIKTNLNLEDLNLTEYLFNKDPSLKDHPNFDCIRSNLSNKINIFINKKCQIFTESDVLLLKTVGKIILKKILEKCTDIQSMKDLEIKLPPESRQNKIHFIENTLGHPPKVERMRIIKKLNPLVKLRVFNIDEDNSIREYWSKFQKEYNITNIQPFLSNGLEMALYLDKRKDFVRYISTGLPNRLLCSVYSRFNTLFNGYQDKTRFSKEEDQLIMKVDECDAIKNKWALLSLILNRSRLQLFRRHNTLKNQIKNQKRMNITWDNNKRQQLFTNILLETNTKHWKDLKNMTITKDTWLKIEKNLDGLITHEQAKAQWNYISTMLFCEKPIKKTSFKLNVLKLLIEINPKHWSDLNWTEITNKLYPGANSKLIVSTFHIWIKRIPSEIKKNVADTLDYLQKYQMDNLVSQISKGKDLEWPRLTVEDYDLLVEY